MAWQDTHGTTLDSQQRLHTDNAHSAIDYPSAFDPALTSQHRTSNGQSTQFQVLDPYVPPVQNLVTRPRLGRGPNRGQQGHLDSTAESQKRELRPQLSAPLRLQTEPSDHLNQTRSDSNTPKYPSLSAEASFSTQVSNDSHESTPSSPKAERLPSFRQLSKIAAAGQEESECRPASYPAAPAFPSAISSQSPVISPQQHYNQPQRLSPVNNFSYMSQASPVNTFVEPRDPYYATSPSSATYPAPPYYPTRRSVPPSNSAPPSLPPSLPSASSSNDSHGQQSSGNEGYSTARTTPIESSVSLDTSGRPTLPLLPNMQSDSSNVQGTFICDFPACGAAPFQTQYLLNSHANVHSSSRPHYCPVAGCPRSEGGKGFKRKNEMIRHGLVHDSPGYMCPFCPDREHRYPRPDNLQRHVRVHHIDKDKDDPTLRDVLAQRAEGAHRGRRRRTGP